MALYTVEIDVTFDSLLDDEVEDAIRGAMFDMANAALERPNESLGAVASFEDNGTVVLVVVDADSPAGAQEAAEAVVVSVLTKSVHDGVLGAFSLEEPVRVVAGRAEFDAVAGLSSEDEPG